MYDPDSPWDFHIVNTKDTEGNGDWTHVSSFKPGVAD